MPRGGVRGPVRVGVVGSGGRNVPLWGCCWSVEKQEVRTLMTVTALGFAQVQRFIVLIPVVSG